MYQSLSLLFFCFNLDVNLARQRRLFSGNLPAMFILEHEKLAFILTVKSEFGADLWY